MEDRRIEKKMTSLCFALLEEKKGVLMRKERCHGSRLFASQKLLTMTSHLLHTRKKRVALTKVTLLFFLEKNVEEP